MQVRPCRSAYSTGWLGSEIFVRKLHETVLQTGESFTMLVGLKEAKGRC